MTEKEDLPNWRELCPDAAVERMPWYFPDLDPDLARALDTRGLESGRLLDLGTGPATQAFALQTLSSLVAPGGCLFLKCFSEQQPGDYGPYRLSPQDIETNFGAAFEFVAIERTVYQGTMAEQPQALFCTLRRKR